MTLGLQQQIIYGPVNSRRLGQSLGINILPTKYKLCSFNCIYCQYGWTNVHAGGFEGYASDLPGVSQVLEEVEKALRSRMSFQYITFSGNGESTLHPRFPEIAAGVKKLRDRHRPEVKTALLSNSSGILLEPVREAIGLIDAPFLKLDAGTERKFLQINRPAKGMKFEQLTAQLRSLKNIYIQTIFFEGHPSNTDDESLKNWQRQIREINPREVQIYTLDRKAPHLMIKAISARKLSEIEAATREQTGVNVRAFSR